MGAERLGWVLLGAIAIAGAAACGGDDAGAPDGGACESGVTCIDASIRDARIVSDRPLADRVDAPICEIGQACTEGRGCSMGICMPEFASGIDEPIRDLPAGAPTETIAWPDGYCSAEWMEGEPGACNPDAEGTDEGCGSCGTCVRFTFPPLRSVWCMLRCVPSATESGCDRSGYTCDFGWNACVTGCSNDTECRVYREDTDMNGTYTEVPIGVAEIDQLVYDTRSMAFCSPTTWRCEQPGAPGAIAGDPCTRDSECEANGRCLSQVIYDWPGGYCTKYGCDVAGNECAGDGRCMDLGVHICVQPCDVGAEATQPYVIGALGHGEGCRDTYACIWNGVDPAVGAGNGGCIPGEYNDITANNVGSACEGPDADAKCYSPFGIGRCIEASDWFAEEPFPATGYCTILGCAAPGLPADLCGAGNQCVSLGGDTRICAKGCTTADDCSSGYGCVDLDGVPETGTVCFPACATAADCRATERCFIPVGDMIGRCAPL